MVRSNLVPKGFKWGKVEKVHISVAVVLCYVEKQSISAPINSRSQGRLMISAKRTHGLFVLKSFLSETNWQITIVFHKKPVLKDKRNIVKWPGSCMLKN